MYTISIPRYTVISVIEDVVSCCIDHVALIYISNNIVVVFQMQPTFAASAYSNEVDCI